MSRQAEVLARWNELGAEAAAREVLPCCGSKAWAERLAARRPFAAAQAVMAAADEVWRGLPVEAWHEAFDSHPRIGERKAQAAATAESLHWSGQEQGAAMADAEARGLLAPANRAYEERFGRIFIVCATGKGAAEILSILRARMQNDQATELHEAAEQQRQITQLRLRRWLGGE